MMNLQGPWVVRSLAAIGAVLAFVGTWLGWSIYHAHVVMPPSPDATVFLIQLAEEQAYLSKLIVSAVVVLCGITCVVGACIVAAIQGRD